MQQCLCLGLLNNPFIFVLSYVVDVSEFYAQLDSHDLLDHFVIFIVHNISGSGGYLTDLRWCWPRSRCSRPEG